MESQTAANRGGATSSPTSRAGSTTGSRSTRRAGRYDTVAQRRTATPCDDRDVRRLLPTRGDVDLDQAYAYPTEGPWLRANMVCTVDGSIAAADGRSGGISGP